jgi:hypothetical protein
MERLVEMGGAEGRTVCVRDQFQVIGRETSFVQCSANIFSGSKFFVPFWLYFFHSQGRYL